MDGCYSFIHSFIQELSGRKKPQCLTRCIWFLKPEAIPRMYSSRVWAFSSFCYFWMQIHLFPGRTWFRLNLNYHPPISTKPRTPSKNPWDIIFELFKMKVNNNTSYLLYEMATKYLQDFILKTPLFCSLFSHQ